MPHILWVSFSVLLSKEDEIAICLSVLCHVDVQEDKLLIAVARAACSEFGHHF